VPYAGRDGGKRDDWMDSSRLLYHFEIREGELATTGDPAEIRSVEACLLSYRGQLRTRTEMYKEGLE